MLIFAVDDEPKALRVLSRAITEAVPEAAERPAGHLYRRGMRGCPDS